MFGSRKTIGAAIIPATAPSTAASPQPSASIQPTRTPTSRLASGFTADARSASPSFVKRKKSPEQRATSTKETTMIPRSWIENATPPTSDGARRERALGKCLDLGAPDPAPRAR